MNGHWIEKLVFHRIFIRCESLNMNILIICVIIFNLLILYLIACIKWEYNGIGFFFFHELLLFRKQRSSHWIKISIDFRFNGRFREWWKPCQRESTKYCLNTFPTRFSCPACLFFFQLFDTLFAKWKRSIDWISMRKMQIDAFTYRFIIPYRIHLWAKHNECEHSKQQCFKCEEQ